MTLVSEETMIQAESATTSTPMVSLRSLKKQFRRKNGDIVSAIDDVNIEVKNGEFLVLLGPSGCGKTTLLRTIAGLEVPDDGKIEIHGKTVFDKGSKVSIPAERRDLGMIFQSYALWPHMSVAKNIAYPLKARRDGLSRVEIAAKVDRILELLGLSALGDSFPGQLSGGQQQRVALARALVGGRRLILFDEPLSNVDAKVREVLRRELKTMQAELGFSAVYVTHDQTEAMELADRIAVVREGRVEQLADPQALYDAPVSRYVADFIGAANLVEAKIVGVESNDVVKAAAPWGPVVAQGRGFAVGDDVILLARPERCEVTARQGDSVNAWPVEVGRRIFYGPHVEVSASAGGVDLRAWIKDGVLDAEATEGWLQISPEHVRALRP